MKKVPRLQKHLQKGPFTYLWFAHPVNSNIMGTSLHFSFCNRFVSEDIPAHVGKRKDQFQAGVVPGGYPRTRGKKTNAISSALTMMGSPPHTRGKAPEELESFISLRITLAYPGKVNTNDIVMFVMFYLNSKILIDK